MNERVKHYPINLHIGASIFYQLAFFYLIRPMRSDKFRLPGIIDIKKDKGEWGLGRSTEPFLCQFFFFSYD